MALREITTTWRYAKSYSTRERLMKRIQQDMNLYPEYDDRFIVIRTPESRWTALVVLDKNKGGYLGRYEFMKV